MRDRDSVRALALVSELGFGVAGPLVVCTGAGWYFDGQWGTGHWLVMTGLLLGLLGAGYSFYRLATAFPPRKPGAVEQPTAPSGHPATRHAEPPDDTGSTRSKTE